MSQRPWFPLYPGEYLGDTMHLSLEEHGAYLKLLMHAWNNGGFIPEENRLRSRILGIHHHRGLLLWGVIGGYWKLYPGGYRNKRLDAELAKAQAVSEKRAEAAEKRWHANADANAYTPTPTTTYKTKKGATHPKKVAKKKLPDPPQWLDPEAWDQWVSHRKEIRKPLTQSQVEAQFRKLDKYRADGDDPTAVIDQSIAGGWQGLFPVKHNNGRSNGNGRYETPHERIHRLNGGATADNEPEKVADGTGTTVDSPGWHLRR